MEDPTPVDGSDVIVVNTLRKHDDTAAYHRILVRHGMALVWHWYGTIVNQTYSLLLLYETFVLHSPYPLPVCQRRLYEDKVRSNKLILFPLLTFCPSFVNSISIATATTTQTTIH